MRQESITAALVGALAVSVIAHILTAVKFRAVSRRAAVCEVVEVPAGMPHIQIRRGALAPR